ncbi:MAG: universal stress protein [Bacteroidales bacterium]|nr:universal stress protein [Bacteroidales bacterium]MBN2819558.1 universal stress protein [Bacteroidales bacterium]
MRYRRILIAVHDSKYSERTARLGISLANDLSAELTLVYVVESVYTIGSIDSGILPQESEKENIAKGRKILEGFIAKYPVYNNYQLIVKTGDPSTEILKQAGQWKADLIVIGRHGLESFKHLVFGGVVDEVATHAHIPVMLVPFTK